MPTRFLGIYTALYSYVPQSDEELALEEGDLLYVVEKSTEDDWWRAKKKTGNAENEPEGLIPNNYVEEAKPIGKCKALYDYTRQTEEELSFSEDAELDVYDKSDENWTLVGLKGEYGFAPANYIEHTGGASAAAPAAAGFSGAAPPPAPPLPTPEVSFKPPAATGRPRADSFSDDDTPAPKLPPATHMPQNLLASIRSRGAREEPESPAASPPPQPPREPPREARDPPRPANISVPPPQSSRPSEKKAAPRSVSFAAPSRDDDSDSDSSEGPRLPVRRPPAERAHRPRQGSQDFDEDYVPMSPTSIPAGFRAWPVMEYIGKKKHAATLALGPGRIILIPDKSTNPKQDWKIDNLVTHSYDGKHVYLDVNHPTKAMDLHAGSKEAAMEISQTLGELRGASRSEGLAEVFNAAKNKGARHIGTILWDFAASEEGEVSVTAGDSVTILDDTEEEWWLVRRAVNGAQGVVPSSYVERGRVDVPQPLQSPAGERKDNRDREREKERERERERERDRDQAEVGPGMRLPTRSTSLAAKRHTRVESSNSTSSSSRTPQPRSKPDISKVRQWTDRSGSYKVDAQFLGYRDGKIQLHKLNGVKIVVPVSKMSVEDLEYVERVTGISLDEEKPLSSIKRDQQRAGLQFAPPPQPKSPNPEPKKITYDWFDFFLTCGVDVADCQRYANSFERDRMDETVLPDITPQVMRTLGLKEGDILRVSKYLDAKFRDGEPQSNGGLFAGPGGALKNNTKKGRPAPAIQTPTTVDPKAFEAKSDDEQAPTPISKVAPPAGQFEDDAWTPKPSKQPAKPATPQPQPQQQPAPVQKKPDDLKQLTGSAKELSILDAPLEPAVVVPPKPEPSPAPVQQPQYVQQPPPTIQTPQPQPQYVQLQPQHTIQPVSIPVPQVAIAPMQTGYQRPQAPALAGNGLIPPPPQRPLSAPQQQFAGLQPSPQPLVAHVTGQPVPVRSVAPQGQMSMNDMNMLRLQQQQQQLQQQQQQQLQQQQLLAAQNTGMPMYQQQPMMPQPTGQFPQMQSPQNNMQFPVPMINQPGQFPLVQQQGPSFQPGFQTPLQPQHTQVPVNSILPPPLVPQHTFLQSPPNLGGGMQPLVPQPTGPAPAVRFGVKPEAKKLVPQPTGRANLAKATPDNPFGF